MSAPVSALLTGLAAFANPSASRPSTSRLRGFVEAAGRHGRVATTNTRRNAKTVPKGCRG